MKWIKEMITAQEAKKNSLKVRERITESISEREMNIIISGINDAVNRGYFSIAYHPETFSFYKLENVTEQLTERTISKLESLGYVVNGQSISWN